MSAHETIDEHKRIIKLYEISEKEFIESIKPVSSGSTLDNFGSNPRQLTDVSYSGGGATTNIGIINGNKTVDLAATSKDVLYGTLMGDSTITFSNPDTITNLNLELVIGTIITNLIVGGVTVDLSDLSVGNKIYLEVSTVNSGSTWDVIKKKLVDLPPSIPRSLDVTPSRYGVGFAEDQLTATWLPSLEGESIKYVAEISTDSNFVTIFETKTDIDGLSYSFLNLTSNTRYYIRVKGVNDFGESEWYPSPPYYSVRTLNPVASIPQVDFKVPNPEFSKIILDWNELTDDYYSFRYTLIRDYIDGVNAKEYVLFRSKTYVESQSTKTDTLNLVSGDDYTYRLIVQFLDDNNVIVATVTYTKQVTVPNPSDPTHDDGTGEKIVFRLSSGGSGFVAQILLESNFDGIYWELSLQSGIDSDGHFTYRPADGFVYRSVFESDSTEILKSIDFIATPGETYYVHYKLFNFPDNPNNYSDWSQTKSLTISAASKPEIGRLRAFDESDSQIRLTVNSDNASADNQQTLTIKRSLDGIDFTDIHTELVSSTGTITYYDDTVAYPTEYHYQAILSSTGGADVSNIVTETPTAPPNPTTPTVSYSLTNQDERRGIEYAAVKATITKTSPGVYPETYDVLVEPRNSSDVTLTASSITNQGDTTTRTTSTYRDDVDSYVRVSVRAKRTLDGVYSAWSSRVINYINA